MSGLENASLPLYGRLFARVTPWKKCTEKCCFNNDMYRVPSAEDFVSLAITMACPVQGKVNVILYKSGI